MTGHGKQVRSWIGRLPAQADVGTIDKMKRS